MIELFEDLPFIVSLRNNIAIHYFKTSFLFLTFFILRGTKYDTSE